MATNASLPRRICGLAGRWFRRRQAAGMADHVGIGEVNDYALGTTINFLNRRVGNGFGAHLGRLVMRFDILAAFQQNIFFTDKRFFLATI